MKRRVRVSKRWAVLLTVSALLLGLPAAYYVASGSTPCYADIAIHGQLLDETGKPVEGETLRFSFYISPRAKDVEVTAPPTDSQGRFLLETSIPQTVYRNSGHRAVEVQARIILEDDLQVVEYQPGGHRQMSQDHTYENWAEQGVYTDGQIQLFHSLRMAESPGDNPDFQDIAIELGTADNPSLFQIESTPPDTGDKEKPGEGDGGGSSGGGSGGSKDTDKEKPDPGSPPPVDGEGPDEEEPPDQELPEPEIPEPEPENPDESEPPEEEEPPDGEEDQAEPEGPVPWEGTEDESHPGGTSGSGDTAISLSKEEREGLRNITFIKWSYQQTALPGEEITYGFTGFENAFPYPLKQFTIVDEPDPGLDLAALELPAFRQGEGLTYDVTYITNNGLESALGREYPADRPQSLKPPELTEGEHITELSIRLAEVPPGFGKYDEIQMTFRVWDDPPEDDLHNQGFLYYMDKDEKVSLRSDDRHSIVAVREARGDHDTDQWNGLEERNDLIHGGRKSLSKATAFPLLILLLMAAVTTAWWSAQKKRKTLNIDEPEHRQK